MTICNRPAAVSKDELRPEPASVEDLTEMYAALPYEEVRKHGEAVANALVLFAQARNQVPEDARVKLTPKPQPLFISVGGPVPTKLIEAIKRQFRESLEHPTAWRVPILTANDPPHSPAA